MCELLGMSARYPTDVNRSLALLVTVPPTALST